MIVTESEKDTLMNLYKKEKNADIAKRLQLIILIRVDGKSASTAAKTLHMSRSWGPKWYKRYMRGGADALKSMPKSGRTPKVPRQFMKRIGRLSRKAQRCWTAEEMQDFIFQMTGQKFELSYVRKLMKKWGYTMKVPVLMHVNRASRRRIQRFQKKIKKTVTEAESEDYTICMQDETIVTADARARKEVYTYGNYRAVYTYTGSHSKTIVFGLITANGEGHFEQHDKFTKVEFEEFLRNACEKFGKILMILDRAPQHRAKDIQEAIEELDGQVKLAYLPPGCPDLNAIEELWRQMKMSVLRGPYIKYAKLCSDIDEWLQHQLPSLDIYKHLYRNV